MDNLFDGSLVGKTVGIKDKRMLEFFYPNFEIKDTLFFDKENSVIFIGKYVKDIKSYLDSGTKQFINTVGPVEIDLDVRENMIRFVYSKWKKEPNESVLDMLNNLDDEDFNNFIKTYWVSGKSNIDKNDTTIFDLYKLMGKNKMDLIKVYYKLLDCYDVEIVESSVITFIEKAVNFENIEASPFYMRLLKEFRDKYKDKIGVSMRKYNTLDTDRRLKVLWLLLQF